MAESLRNVILSELKARFPEISWAIGSVVRELVVEPLCKLGDTINSYVNTLENSLDITSIIQDPANNKEAIDAWMSRLGLSTASGKKASGTVKILFSKSEEVTILKGSTFYWNDVYLVTTEDNILSAANNSYRNYNNTYEAEVSVTTIDSSHASLGSGTPINWDNAPSTVIDMYVGSPITGGFTEPTYQEKANMISNALSPVSFSGEQTISSTLARQYPDDVVNVVVGPRDASNPYNVNLYLKVPYTPSLYSIDSVVNDNGKIVIDTIGVSNIRKVYDTNGGLCSVNSIAYSGDFGSTGSFVTIDAGGVRAGDKVSVEVSGYPIYKTIQKQLDLQETATPFGFTLKLPVIALVGFDFTTAGDVTYDHNKVAVNTYINNKPLDAAISDSELRNVLSEQGITVVGDITYSVLINNHKFSRVFSTVGNLAIQGEFATDGVPVALYGVDNRSTITNAY